MWAVTDAPASTTVAVRVRHTGDPAVANTSATFILRGAITSVDEPLANAIWKVGTSKTITWKSSGAQAIPAVAVEYSTNAFSDETQTTTIIGSDTN